ncbi:ABC transporter ATP-binding protein [Dictyobacter aurantiacus]|uniref:Helicase n=1 Tax=Dictyobacter aurantiacus TaxID=1936993 RepID=A0A401ZF88_9CHLR|nr:ABC transporter ATP-binding protein [Dictyobacter aurantiacus]GCE05463.1 helicase [Dictyobacter aurantiacus]
MPVSLDTYRHLLLTYLKPQWPRVVLLILLLAGTIGISLINPLILRAFVDGASSQRALADLITIAIFFLVLSIVRQIIAIAEAYVATDVALLATNALRADLMLHCLQLDSTFHTIHAPGELIERVDGDVTSLSNFFSRMVIALFGNLLLLLGVLILLFLVDWRVGLTLTIFALIALVMINRLHGLATPHWEAERQASAELFGFLEERLNGTEDVRSSGATLYMLQGLSRYARQHLCKLRMAIMINFPTWGTVTFVNALGRVLALLLGAYLYWYAGMSAGTALLIFIYANTMTTPIEQIVDQLRELQQSAGSIQRVATLLEEPQTIADGPRTDLPSSALAVACEDVSFSYTEGVPVLRHIQLQLEPGSVLGLLGRTGSGKSTLTKLLARLYDPVSGSICLNGIDIRSLSLDTLHERVGIVTQEVHILHASVRDNLTLFDSTIKDTQVLAALQTLGLQHWYQSLEDGLDTVLAPGGSGLSAGEAQLLAFARVFLRDPGLVILDEASSRLDPATERLLEQAIDTLLKGRTGIIIAHRLSTVQRADHIMILEQGECREYGVRQDLACDPESHFAQLLRIGLEEALA